MSEVSDSITLVFLRKRANKTQRQVADLLDVKAQTVSDWERGVTEPHLRPIEMKQLIEFFGCTFDELVEAFEEARQRRSRETHTSA